MNYLERLANLLSVKGATVKYGELLEESTDPIIAIQQGESLVSKGHIGDGALIQYATVDVTVYSLDYMIGFNLLESSKNEIKIAQKDNVVIMHVKDYASVYNHDKQRYEFRANFKIIKI